MADRKIIPVLGMHRSGTSAITRGLQVLSVELGDNLMPPAAGNNDKGFWEDLEIVRFNELLLSKLSSSWDRLAPISAEVLLGSAFSNERYEAARLIDTKVNGHDAFAFKDPRTTVLMPFWRCIFDDLELDDRYLIAVRNPLEVARSLHNRDAFSISKGLTLWAKHMLQAVQSTGDKPRIFTSFDAVLKAPFDQLERIALGLDLVRPDPKGAAAIDYSEEFLDTQLRQHLIPKAELKRSDDILPIVVDLYTLMSEWVRAKPDAAIENPEKELARFQAHLDGARPLLVHADQIELDWRRTDRERTDLASAKTKLEERVSGLERERAELQDAQERADAEIDELNDQLLDRAKKVDSLEASIEGTATREKMLNENVTALQAKLDDTESELEELETKSARETEALTTEIRSLETERDEARIRAEDIQQHLSDELADLRARHQADLNALKTEAERLTTERDEIKAANEELERQYADKLEALRARHVLDLNSFKSEVGRITDELVSAKTQFAKDLDEVRTERNASLAKSKERFDSLSNDHNELRERYLKDVKGLKSDNEQLSHDRDELKERYVKEVTELRAENDRLEEQRRSDRDKIGRLQRDRTAEQANHAASEKAAASESNDLRMDLERLRRELERLTQSKDEEINTLRVRAADYRKDLLLTKAESRALRSSTSWRLTKPLRAFGRIVNRPLASKSPAQITKQD